MADVNINKFRASVVRDGSKPASPGFIVSEGQDPVDPAGNGQNHLPVTIATAATGLSITDSQVLGGAGTVGQYIRGDGSLADFPQASGGGSSVSYYLNGSVAQGTIGGVAYKELNKVPILGTGTDFTINANGYIASFLTDAGDPNLLEIPGGNWNFETYFSASSGGGSPSFYVELYKYDGTTFTLIASSSSSPELIAFGTNLNPYFSTLAVPTTTLALTDRLAVRYYVNHSGRTITLHTENNHLCQVVTTFTTGLTSLNGLTAQVQNLAVGTSGTDFNIASATATHTFNLPTASATNRGALSSADWTTFNNKQNALTLTTSGSSGASTLVGATLNVPTYTLSGLGGVPTSRQLTINGTAFDLSADRSWSVGTVTSVGLSSATSGVTIGGSPVTGVGAFTLAIATASGSQNGLLSSTDWTTFNNKQNALTNPVTGTGVSGRVAYWNGTNSITSNSALLFDGNTLTVANFLSVGQGINVTKNLVAGEATPLHLTYTTSDGAAPAIRFGSTQGFWDIQPSNNNQRLTFEWGDSVNALSLFSTGNVTIGATTDNGARLQVSGAAGGQLIRSQTTIAAGRNYLQWANGSGDMGYIGYGGPDNKFYVSNQLNEDMIFSTNNLERMRITSGGNVGIGTASPTDYSSGGFTTLHINGRSGTGGGVLRLTSFDASCGVNIYAQSNAVVFNTTTASPFAWLTQDVTRMTITSSGNVGIGTTGGINVVSGWTNFVVNGSTTGLIGVKANEVDYGAMYASIANNAFVIQAYGASNSGNMVFLTASTERMRITSGGNVGIGTLSPSGPLHIYRSVTSGLGGHIILDNNGTAIGNETALLFSDGGLNNTRAAISSTVEDAPYFGDIKFKTGVSSYSSLNTRMIIKGNGNVLIGTTTDSGAKLHVQGDITLSGEINCTGRLILDAGAGNGFLFRTDNVGVTAIDISSAGNCKFSSLGTGIVYSNGGTLTSTNPSDFNLKENIAPINYGLSEILQLNAVTFHWKNDKINQGKQYGFIAQEVEKIMPDLVKKGEYLGLDREAIFTTLVKAIQELKQEIDTLKN